MLTTLLSIAIGLLLILIGRSYYLKNTEESSKSDNPDQFKEAILAQFKEAILDKVEITAQNILDKQTNKLKEESKDTLIGIINPMEKTLKKFEEKIEKYYQDENNERFSLKDQINLLIKSKDDLMLKTTDLTDALKGDSRSQGAWGEMVLSRVLEVSGLREGEEYTTQGKEFGLKSEDGNPLKPDAIIRLPKERYLVVDSKVSLTDYARMNEEKDADQKQVHLKKFIQSIQQHIKDLSIKNYTQAFTEGSVDFVFLFFPLESAFSLILKDNSNLLEEAWKQSVIIVSPTSLLATLKTIESMWKKEKSSKSVLEIIKLAESLHNKFQGSIKSITDIGESLDKSKKSFDEAMNKLQTGKGSVASILSKIEQKGVKVKNTLTIKAETENEEP